MIISEPPNLWVVGMENLYTPYFYNLAHSRLAPDGIFVQWMHTYSMSPDIISTVLSNLKKTFKNITAFHTGDGDIAFFSSNRSEPFKIHDRYITSPSSREVAVDSGIDSTGTSAKSAQKSDSSLDIEPTIKEVLRRLRVEKISDLNFYQVFNNLEIDALVVSQKSFVHEILYPKLNQKAYFSFYSGSRININNLLNPMFRRVLREQEPPLFNHEGLEVGRLKSLVKNAHCENSLIGTDYPNFPCLFLVRPYKAALKNIKDSKVKKQILAYSVLRDRGFIEKDISFFKKAIENMPSLKHKKEVLKTSKLITNELLNEGEHDLAKEFVKKLEKRGFIDKDDMVARLKMCDEAKTLQDKFLENLANTL